MRLYDQDLSGNRYRVRLRPALPGQAVDPVTVNLRAGTERAVGERSDFWMMFLKSRGGYL